MGYSTDVAVRMAGASLKHHLLQLSSPALGCTSGRSFCHIPTMYVRGCYTCQPGRRPRSTNNKRRHVSLSARLFALCGSHRRMTYPKARRGVPVSAIPRVRRGYGSRQGHICSPSSDDADGSLLGLSVLHSTPWEDFLSTYSIYLSPKMGIRGRRRRRTRR